MDYIMEQGLDRYITGNYGEDQFRDNDEELCSYCDEMAEFVEEDNWADTLYCIRCAIQKCGHQTD